MALKTPPRAAEGQEGELINWGEEFKRLAADKTLVVFRVKERLEDEDYGNGPIPRLVNDILIASGPRKGEVHTDVWALGRGITNTLLRAYEPDKTGETDNDVAVRLDLGQRGTTKYVQANEPSPIEVEAMDKVYRDGAGFNGSNGKAPAYAGGQAADASDAPF
jgi:hypothetical protein